MPKIDFCFSGFVQGADINECVNFAGQPVDVSKMNPKELAAKLEKGELFISLGDHLYCSRKNEIEIFDFEDHDG